MPPLLPLLLPKKCRAELVAVVILSEICLGWQMRCELRVPRCVERCRMNFKCDISLYCVLSVLYTGSSGYVHRSANERASGKGMQGRPARRQHGRTHPSSRRFIYCLTNGQCGAGTCWLVVPNDKLQSRSCSSWVLAQQACCSFTNGWWCMSSVAQHA
ncbi:hypothetical protein JKP88DRAFT_24145 [Tribonema minus]|uniref:Uncharacterized protein n=1 Tax=Tribonema minus TaxID=303371 RepID=A0A836CK01_9STRA|nr:hypothetical protein JKP88DRAFT_24145 [Tribonema minus]